MSKKEVCLMCEAYMSDTKCDNDECPVAKVFAENKRLKERISTLTGQMSYMSDPLTIGDRHEMGG